MKEGLPQYEPGNVYFEEFSGSVDGALVTRHRPNANLDKDTWFNHNYDGIPVPADVIERAAEFAESEQQRLGQLYYTRLIVFVRNGDRGNISFDSLEDLLKHI